MINISVLGCGSWGTALAMILAYKGYNVSLWGRNKEFINEIQLYRENKKYLKNIKLLSNINVTNDLMKIIPDADFIVLAIPTQGIRSTVKLIKNYLKDNTIIINTAKGLEDKTFLRLSQVIKEELDGRNNIAVLSGPSHAEEVAQFLPTTIVASSEKKDIAEKVQDLFMASCFRVYTNPDLIGVEYGGALKNIIALATGISDGLGYGDNTRAAIMTRGLSEILRLGVSLKANPVTFAGLTGIGDLIVTCNSMHSRNRRAGILLGEGYSIDIVLDKVGMVVEGVNTTKVALKLAKKQNIPMPITEEIYEFIINNKNPKNSVSSLMERQKKHETEDIALPFCNELK